MRIYYSILILVILPGEGERIIRRKNDASLRDETGLDVSSEGSEVTRKRVNVEATDLPSQTSPGVNIRVEEASIPIAPRKFDSSKPLLVHSTSMDNVTAILQSVHQADRKRANADAAMREVAKQDSPKEKMEWSGTESKRTALLEVERSMVEYPKLEANFNLLNGSSTTEAYIRMQNNNNEMVAKAKARADANNQKSLASQNVTKRLHGRFR